MACFLLSSCSLSLSFCRLKELKHPQVRSQSFRNDANMVDRNMGVLRERIAEVKMKERLKKYKNCGRIQNGWNYQSERYVEKYKRFDFICECVELMTISAASLGLVFLTGFLSICFLSLLLRSSN